MPDEGEEERRYRRDMRLEGYDYGQAGAYFITVCTRERASLLGEIVDGTMHLSLAGHIVEDEWRRTPAIRMNVVLDEHIVMPNHIHGIVLIAEDPVRGTFHTSDVPGTPGVLPVKRSSVGLFRSPSQTVGAMVRGFKAATTSRIRQLLHAHAMAVWQRNYYEHVIRSEEDMDRIREYIVNNARRWADDKYCPT